MSESYENAVSDQDAAAAPDALPAQRGIATLMMLLAAAGLAVAVALTVQGFATTALPGCGGDSGCSTVLASKWAKMLGVPVALPAGLMFLGVTVLAFIVHRRPSEAATRAAWSVLVPVAAAGAMVAAWFIALQHFVIGEFCPYCMTSHVIAILLATLACSAAPFAMGWLAPRLAAAVVMAAVFIGVQTLTALEPPTTAVTPVGHDFDQDIEGRRVVGVLDGRVGLHPPEYPMLGSPDADVVLVMLFDFTCYHCRTMHKYLVEAERHFDGKLAIVLLPSPLDVDCNDAITHQESAHATGCDLAELAMAVWKVDPAAFKWFDAFLTGGEDTTPVDEARAQAEELVGAEALQEVIDSGWPRQQVKSFTKVYEMYNMYPGSTGRIPVLMGRGQVTAGVPENAEALIADLTPMIQAALQATSNGPSE